MKDIQSKLILTPYIVLCNPLNPTFTNKYQSSKNVLLFMASFKKGNSLKDLQSISYEIYGLLNDRNYSISDLLSNLQKFTMRALKGIRKNDIEKIDINLLIAISWLMAIANRLHIDVQTATIEKFAFVCSYCKTCPCSCKKNKVTRRVNLTKSNKIIVRTLKQFQEMFSMIYPPETRNLTNAGIHMAEETGELSEAIHNFQGEHLEKQFENIKSEMADYISCFFGVINSLDLNLEKELMDKYSNNCHECHKAPCVCTYSFASSYKS